MTTETLHQDFSIEKTAFDPHVVLDVLRHRFTTSPTVFLAGEINREEDDDSRFEVHTFFIAPRITTLEARQLNAFTKAILAGIPMDDITLAQKIRGDLHMPDAYVDQVIGYRIETQNVTNTIFAGNFHGLAPGTSSSEHTYDPVELIQRTHIKIFPDILVAQAVFDHLDAEEITEIDNDIDGDAAYEIQDILNMHILTPKYIRKLKRMTNKKK
jgi:hypothetical protein